MRILYVTSYYKPAYVYGGPVRLTATLCESLAQHGADVTVYTTNANGAALLSVPLGRPVDDNGVSIWYFPLTMGGLSYFFSRRLQSAVNQSVSEYDIVVVDGVWGHSIGVTFIACERQRRPYVVSLMGQLQPWALAQNRRKKSLYLRLIGRRALDGSAALHCTDLSEAEGVRVLGLRSPVFVVPGGIDPTPFSAEADRGRLRQRLGISADGPLLLFLGRLTRIKRPDIAIDALAAARSIDPAASLIIAGPDEDGMTPNLLAHAQKLGCADGLRITGLLDTTGVRQALVDADLLLMPTEVQENFGMSALEALAAGVPILVSDGVPMGRWALAAGAGCVEPSTARAFAQATVEMLSEPGRLQAMGECGRQLVRREFASDVVARRMLAHYQAIASRGYPLSDAEIAEVMR